MNKKIVFPELVDMLVEINGTSRKISETFLKELFNILKEAFENGDSVRIKNFGVFKVVKTESRKSIDINTGKEIEIPEHNRITFTPDKDVSEAVNKSFAGFETIELDNDISEEEVNKLSETDNIEDTEEVAEAEENTEEPEATIEDELKSEPESAAVEKPENVLFEENYSEEVETQKAAVIQDETEPLKDTAEIFSEPVKKETEEIAAPVIEEDAPSETEKAEELVQNIEETEPELVEEPENDSSSENTEEYIDDYYSDKQKKYKRKFRKGFFWGILTGIIVTSIISFAIIYFAAPPAAISDDRDLNTITEAIQDSNVTINGNGDSVAADTVEVKEIEKPKTVTDTVKGNRFLTTMAREHYGNFNFWVYIYEENKDKIKNPDRINKGTIVVIPAAEKYQIDKNDSASIKRAEKKAREITNKFNN